MLHTMSRRDRLEKKGVQVQAATGTYQDEERAQIQQQKDKGHQHVWSEAARHSACTSRDPELQLTKTSSRPVRRCSPSNAKG